MIQHSRSLAGLALLVVVLAACGKARPALEESGGGLRLSIQGATVNANRQVVVTYRLTDRNDLARGLGGVTNSWTLASLSKDAIGVPMYVAWVKNGQDLPTGEKQPGAESENATTGSQDLSNGTFRYTYQTQLPEGFDPNATYRVGVFSRLQVGTDATGAATFDPDQPNAVFDFVPAGGTPQSREIVSDAACATCHVQVQAHGGFRRGVQICTTCHTTQLLDPDTTDPAKLEPANPLDLGRLVHRIHRGRQLQTVQNVLNAAAGCPTPTSTVGCPTTPPPLATRQAAIAAGEAAGVARYHVIGFRGSDNVFGAAAVRTENGVSTVYASGVNLPPPNDVRNCTVCHQGAKDARQHLTTVERRICTACHADVWFDSATVPDAYHVLHTTNVGPLTLPQINDNSCAACHSQDNAPAVDATHPLSSLEFGRYVDYAHTVPVKSQQLAGLKAEIVSFTNSGPGQNPTLVFKLSDSTGTVTNGSTNPIAAFSPCASPSGSVRATLNGPTTPDYQFFPNNFQEELVFTRNTSVTPNVCTPDRATYDPATGNWTHVFTKAIPAGATGTWGMGIEARRAVRLKNPDEVDPAATFTVNEGAFNPITYFAVDGGTATPRKIAVVQEKCNACHLALQFHGNQRDSVEYCVLCHTPDNTDWTRRPKTGSGASAVVNVAATPDNKEERSIHFKPMIHRIHTGKGLDRQKPYVISGGFFDEGGLPDTALPHCELCHDGDAYKLEAMPAGRLPTVSNESSTTVHVGSAAPVPGESSIAPMTAACISCHDTQKTAAHAQTFAPPVVPAERCIECHGDRGVRAVSRVHPVTGVTTQ